ncbi:MAG: putative metallopeptidase [Candidatus Aenigmatarchaeota archaeon]
MKYFIDHETQNIIKDIIEKLNFNHIKFENLICIKSVGSKSKRTIARIHGLPKIMQVALNSKAFYVIEIISENFDKLSYQDKIKTLIHELMHIPKNFGGGFRGHRNFVTRKKVEEKFKEYLNFIQ